jgi:hypothetical protein
MSFNSRCASPEVKTRRAVLVLLAGVGALSSVRARLPQMEAPREIQADLPDARLQGQARLRFFGLPVYDIRLWAATPLRGDDALRSSAALEIEYVADIAAADGQRWLAMMKQLFPDVQAGDRITGVHRPGEGARFHFNGRFLGEVRDATFARLFFGIWLSPRTSEPELRAALLGPAP